MSYNTKYAIGELRLAEPYLHFIHKLPLLSFGDIMSTVEVDLIYNSRNATANNFKLANGFKLNLHRQLVSIDDVLYVEDESGTQTACYRIDGEHYVVQDTSQRIIRKCPINSVNKYVLEGPDKSKEIYDLSGKIESCVDKYGNTLLTYEYDAENGNRLKSATYRSNKKIALGYTNNALTSIKYVVGAEEICESTLTYNQNGVVVCHYSGVDYHINLGETSYTAYSTAHGSTVLNSSSEKIQCLQVENGLQFKTMNHLEAIIDTTTYEALNYDGWYKYDILEKTDKNGIKTRIQYENDKPAYSYEIVAGTEDEQFTYNTFRRTVNAHTEGGVSGFITADSGAGMAKVSHGDGFKYFYGTPVDVNPLQNVIISGWIKSSADNLGEVVFMNNDYIRCGSVNVPIKDKWLFFAFAFDNRYQEPEIFYDSQDFVELKDVRITINKKTSSSSEYILFGAGEFAVDKMHFKNKATNELFDPGEVTGKDLMRYFVNKVRGERSNEFYLYGNTAYPSMIVDAGTMAFCDESGDEHLLDDFTLVKRVYVNETFEDIEIDHFKEDGTFDVLYYNNEGDLEKKETYNAQLDLVSVYENDILTTYGRHANGLVLMVLQTGNVNNETMFYNSDYTKLTKKSNDKCVVEYTTDDIWGVTTKVTVSRGGTKVAETQFDLTEDGQDLTTATFGMNSLLTSNDLTYNNGKISQMKVGTLKYNFGYTNNDLTSISKNGTTIKTYSYTNDYKTVTETSPTSTTKEYYYTKNLDNYGRTISIEGLVENEYNVCPYFDGVNDEHHSLDTSNGSAVLSTQTDLKTNETTYLGYDDSANVVKARTKQNSTTVKDEVFEYDEAGRITKDTMSFNLGGAQTSTYEVSYSTVPNSWKTDKRVSQFKHTNGGQTATSTNTYDAYKRQSSKEKIVGGIACNRNIVYNTTEVESVTDNRLVNGALVPLYATQYEYDALSRVTSETESVENVSKSYEYDALGRLVRENNSALNKTYTYEYDSVGNVASKKTHAYTTASTPGTATTTTNFSYDTTHPDRLTSFGGKAITYDQQGCPLTYDGKTYTWTAGKLTKITIGGLSLLRAAPIQSASESWDYTYNGKGQRIKKVYNYIPPLSGTALADYVSNETTNFVYDHNGKLVAERTVKTYKNGNSSVNMISYLHDEIGIIGMVKDNSVYYFHRNMYGDVVGVYNSAGTKVVGFTYDAYGNCTVSGDNALAQYCKIRYRGYYFDTETGLYWVQTRYYNPQWCRWISSDALEYIDPESASGINLYVYCGNDPVNHFDPSGHSFILSMLLSIGISLMMEVIEDAIDGGLGDDSHDWRDYLGAGISGFFSGFTKFKKMGTLLSLAGSLVDAGISGDFKDNGVLNTLTNIGVSMAVSWAVGYFAKRVAARLKATDINKMPRKLANRTLKKIGANINMGSNAVKIGEKAYIVKAIVKSEWIGNKVCDEVVRPIVQGLAALGYGQISAQKG